MKKFLNSRIGMALLVVVAVIAGNFLVAMPAVVETSQSTARTIQETGRGIVSFGVWLLPWILWIAVTVSTIVILVRKRKQVTDGVTQNSDGVGRLLMVSGTLLALWLGTSLFFPVQHRQLTEFLTDLGTKNTWAFWGFVAIIATFIIVICFKKADPDKKPDPKKDIVARDWFTLLRSLTLIVVAVWAGGTLFGSEGSISGSSSKATMRVNGEKHYSRIHTQTIGPGEVGPLITFDRQMSANNLRLYEQQHAPGMALVINGNNKEPFIFDGGTARTTFPVERITSLQFTAAPSGSTYVVEIIK